MIIAEKIDIFSNYQKDTLISKTYYVSWPNKLFFKLSNKNMFNDTKIEDNKIIADKFILLENLVVGMIPVKNEVLKKICAINYNKFDNYWGVNGKVEINFNHDNFLQWHLHNNNKFTVNHVN